MIVIAVDDERYALEKRPNKGLLAGLFQFPNLDGWLETEQALTAVAQWSLNPTELMRQVHRKHIFTHIQWEMNGIYLEVDTPAGEFQWFTAEQIRQETALPTAFRQFWEEIENV